MVSLGKCPAGTRYPRHSPQDRRHEALEAAFADELAMAVHLRLQQKRHEQPKLYSLHAPETKCIGKGKAHKPYEFGCKFSITTTNARAPDGMFILHAKALHGAPYDGHTLKEVIEDLTDWIGAPPERTYVDKGYIGHEAPNPRSVFRSGQKRGVPGQIKREFKRRSAVELDIGHLKEEHRLDRNSLKGREGDRINAVLAAAGYNFRRLSVAEGERVWKARLLKIAMSGQMGLSRQITGQLLNDGGMGRRHVVIDVPTTQDVSDMIGLDMATDQADREIDQLVGATIDTLNLRAICDAWISN